MTYKAKSIISMKDWEGDMVFSSISYLLEKYHDKGLLKELNIVNYLTEDGMVVEMRVEAE